MSALVKNGHSSQVSPTAAFDPKRSFAMTVCHATKTSIIKFAPLPSFLKLEHFLSPADPDLRLLPLSPEYGPICLLGRA
jgi:hypothetical protein